MEHVPPRHGARAPAAWSTCAGGMELVRSWQLGAARRRLAHPPPAAGVLPHTQHTRGCMLCVVMRFAGAQRLLHGCLSPAGWRPLEPAGWRPLEPAGWRPLEPAGWRPLEPAGWRPLEPAG
eukprot:358505-Chlamydomonas_euryale.AAC.1